MLAKLRYHISTFFLATLAKTVNARYCWYTGGDGLTKYYYCNEYQHCCSSGCCEDFMSFYRLWYFWFCILMIMMFCSGGTYWYKKRYIRQRIILDQPYNVNNTTILSVANNAAHRHTTTSVTAWDPYAAVPRPGFPQQIPAGASVQIGTGGQVSYFPPPPAYSAVVNQNNAYPPQQPINNSNTTTTQAPPPSYTSAMIQSLNDNDNLSNSLLVNNK